MRVRSYAPTDPETCDAYLVSPRTGELLVVPNADWGSPHLAQVLAHHEFGTIEQCSPLVESWTALEARPLDAEAVVEVERRRFVGIWRVLRTMLPFAALTRCARAARWAAGQAGAHSLPLDQCIAALGSMERPLAGACLIRSLARAAFLHRHGHPAAVTVGVWTPTLQMHAWAMVAPSSPEEPAVLVRDGLDQVSHYQPALELWLSDG